ncbi:hypothetical protein BGX27_002740 [Mortierella sp. AM989]|nr:hypothetical protein BGX27_002740 [Mortierella sp. AM989]
MSEDKEVSSHFYRIKDIEKVDHFEFLGRATNLQQGSAGSTWLTGLKALAHGKQPKFVKAAEMLQKKYSKYKKDGLLKSYWKKRKAEEELVDEADDATSEAANLKDPFGDDAVGNDLVNGIVDDSVDNVVCAGQNNIRKNKIFRIIDISNITEQDTIRAQECYHQIKPCMYPTRKRATPKTTKVFSVEELEEFEKDLFRPGASTSDRYIRSAVNCLSNLWQTTQGLDKRWHTKRSEVLSSTLKTAQNEGIDVPNYRVDFVVSLKDEEIDTMISEDKPKQNGKVSEDTMKTQLVQETALYLWRKELELRGRKLFQCWRLSVANGLQMSSRTEERDSLETVS